jgi:F0F1-type ATP synthase gamma subunit
MYLRKFKDLSKAVQLVSVAKLKKLAKTIEKRNVSLAIASAFFEALNNANLKYKQCTVVLITSERSCCGKLNNDVVSVVKNALSAYVIGGKLINIISIG